MLETDGTLCVIDGMKSPDVSNITDGRESNSRSEEEGEGGRSSASSSFLRAPRQQEMDSYPMNEAAMLMDA